MPPPKETAATPAGQYQGGKKEPLDKNQPESLVTCSQPERCLIVQSLNSSVFIVPSVPAILEPKGCQIQPQETGCKKIYFVFLAHTYCIKCVFRQLYNAFYILLLVVHVVSVSYNIEGKITEC